MSGIYAGGDLVDSETLRKSEIYNDFCRRLGAFHFLGAGISLNPTTQLILGIHRPMEREDFSFEHRRRLGLVLPHLSRAALVHTMLATAGLQQRLAAEMFETLSIGTILVDPLCKVVFTNQVADRALETGDGLTVRQARLTTRHPRQEAALQHAVKNASTLAVGGDGPACDVVLLRRAQSDHCPFWSYHFERIPQRPGCSMLRPLYSPMIRSCAARLLRLHLLGSISRHQPRPVC